MSRELKFRAWDTQLESYTYSGWGEKTFSIFAKRTNYKRYIIEQYTGLEDKNGVEIYVGDIDPHGWIIKYLDGGFWVVDPNTSFLVGHLHMLNRELEIIGDIHE